MDFVIYGAQAISLGTYEAIKCLYPQRKLLGFVVTDRGMNPLMLAGLPVKTLEEFSDELTLEEKDEVQVMIAVPENVCDEIETILIKYHFYHYQKITSEDFADLRMQYHKMRKDLRSVKELSVGKHGPEVQVFIATSDKDKPLKNDYKYADYMIPIHAGAKQSSRFVAEYRDDVGSNISLKNGNYCELTVLYWVWKNCLKEDCSAQYDRYYGLMQYRRVLLLDRQDLFRLKENRVDVVLPYPMPYEPDIELHHERYVKNADWKVLMEVVKEVFPECMAYFDEILKGRYLYNYNIILAERSVLREYCQWLFAILEKVEQLSVPNGENRSDRYLGYMAETLETLYFMKNKDKLRIVHAGCKLLV